MTYSPMVQLVHYLQGNDFNVYIVTGGEITSVRTVSEETYNIPKENVVGSSVVLDTFLMKPELTSSERGKSSRTTTSR